VDAALTRPAKKTTSAETSKPPALRARAAAAGAQFTQATSDVTEFEVNAVPEGHDDSDEAQQQSEDDSNV
jgi:hypothetical protein